MSPAVTAPFDVRLMNLTATLLFVIAVVMAASALLWWAARHPVFAIRAITVRGDVVHASEQALRSNVAPHLEGNFFTVDLAAARAAFESAPWVRRATVSREFPNRLKVTLKEQQVAALWGEPGGSQMVNVLGEVFEANVGEVEQEDLPRLIGPARLSAHVLDMYRALVPLFQPLDQSVVQLELSGRGNWRLRLESGGEIELGAGSIAEVLARTERFVHTIEQVAANHGREVEAVESADLRYADGYALRLQGVTTGETTAPAAPKRKR